METQRICTRNNSNSLYVACKQSYLALKTAAKCHRNILKVYTQYAKAKFHYAIWFGSVRADSDRPTQRPASSGVQITASATGVLRLPDHVCGTRCQYSYGIVTVSDSLNGC